MMLLPGCDLVIQLYKEPSCVCEKPPTQRKGLSDPFYFLAFPVENQAQSGSVQQTISEQCLHFMACVDQQGAPKSWARDHFKSKQSFINAP